MKSQDFAAVSICIMEKNLRKFNVIAHKIFYMFFLCIIFFNICTIQVTRCLIFANRHKYNKQLCRSCHYNTSETYTCQTDIFLMSKASNSKFFFYNLQKVKKKYLPI